MDAITLWQPWATFIALRLKRIETRTHRNFFCLLHRRIAIHAGRRWDEEAQEWALSVCRSDQREDVLRAIGRARGQMGMVVCTAVVLETRVLGPRDAEAALTQIGDNRYGLVLSEVEPIADPLPVAGHQGIWEWTPPAPDAAPATAPKPATKPGQTYLW